MSVTEGQTSLKIMPFPPETEIENPNQLSRRWQKWARILFLILTLMVTFLVLGYLIFRQQDVLFSYDWQIRPLPLAVSVIFYAGALSLAVLTWIWIMKALGNRLRLKEHIRFYLISHAMRRIPGPFWYLAGRTLLYKKEGVDIRLTSIAIGLEYILIIMSGILASLVFSFSIIQAYDINPWLLVGLFFLTLLAINPRFVRTLLRLAHVEAYDVNYSHILVWLILFLFVTLLSGAVLFFIARAVYPLSTKYLPYVIGSWALVGVISSSLVFLPTNFGVTEIGLSLLLTQIMPSSIAVIVALSARILMTLYDLLAASISFLLINVSQKPPITFKD